jgi:EmrB/QacA subfamily drug resistance transporter
MRAVATASRSVSPWLVLVLVALAQFMVVLDATIVNVALPSIQSDLGLSSSNLQWVVNGYTLVFGGFLLLGGRAADLLGRKRLFLAGVAVFTSASLLNGLAQSGEMLIAARALQGLGGAMVTPAALSIITTTFREGEGRTRALAVWGAVAAGGGAAGLLLGGILTEALSWQWIFFVNVPIGLAAVLLSARFVPESRIAQAAKGFDAAGAATATGGLVLLTYAIVKAGDFGWSDPRTLGLGAVAVSLIAAFVRIERRAKAPLVDLSIFRKRTLVISNATMLLMAGALFSMFFFGSLYLQDVRGYDPLETGLAFLPMTAAIVIGSAMAQMFIRHFGVKPVLLGGLATATAGLAFMTGIQADSDYVTGFLPGIVLIALGAGNVFVPLTLTATTNVDGDHQGLASGIFNTAQQIGAALGLAVLSTVSVDRATAAAAGGAQRPAALVEGFQLAFTVGAAMTATGLLALTFLLRRRDVRHLTGDGPLVAAA